MNLLRVQSAIFSMIAGGVAFLTLMADIPGGNLLTLLCLVAIILLGVPHGALDTLYASRQFPLRRVRDWFWFACAYLLPVVLVASLWRLSPLAFLLGFLGISVFHFSGDPDGAVPSWIRLFWGGAAVVLPNLLHAAEVRRLFAILVEPESAASVQQVLTSASPFWLAGVLAGALWLIPHDWRTSIELAAVALLCTLASPLLSFTIFFCGMHSARHILRSFRYAGIADPRLFAAAAILPTLGTLLLLGVGLWWLKDVPLESRLIQLVFVALAALTVPHMALVERVRFAAVQR